MVLQHAERIIEEAKNDQRLKAELMGTGARHRGYQVRVTLRNVRWVVVHDREEWQDVQMAWSGM